MAIPRRISEDGWEMQLATNHLGHWTFIGLLLDRMLDVEGSRVVSVTSEVTRPGGTTSTTSTANGATAAGRPTRRPSWPKCSSSARLAAGRLPEAPPTSGGI